MRFDVQEQPSDCNDLLELLEELLGIDLRIEHCPQEDE